MSALLGPDGQPIKKPKPGAIKRRYVDSGAHKLMWNSALGELTPWSLSRMLKDHAEGSLDNFLVFAEDAEEKNEHYGSVLGTRKRAVEGLEFSVKPAGKAADDVEIQQAVTELVEAPAFIELVEDLLDALGKGFSVAEIIWHTDEARWTPVDYVHVNPRAFQIDKNNPRRLRLKSKDDRDGIELPAYKFIPHFSKLKSGAPHRAALARFVAWTYLFQNFTLKDWVGYVETYGQPVRVGRYGKEATDDDIAELIRALQNIGSDAAAAIPDSMKMEFIKDASGGGGGKTFKELASYCDERISKAVLGQTMTADSGSSQAQAKVHDDVRTDIKRADARRICTTINRYLICPFVDLNFGPQKRYPMVVAPVLDPEDLKELREAIRDFTEMGMRIPMSWAHSRWGIPQAGEDEGILQAKPAGQPTAGTTAPPVTARRISMARAQASPDAEALVNDILGIGLDDWQQVSAPIIDPVREAIDGAADYAEASKRLSAAFPEMSPGELATSVRDAMASARAVGDATD